MKDLETITSMLSYRRPAGSKSERDFITRFLEPLGVKEDAFGNQILVVGEDSPTVLWSSHTDSVHSKTGFQLTKFDGKYISLPEKSRSNCLGADDAAGVWIMTEMIKANIPGLYIFHYGEEIGCLGSHDISEKSSGILEGIQAAIAFDRRGTQSVITHQGGRCCSDNFGLSLAAQLPTRFGLDPTGVLTDTRIYMRQVPECSNISVGYYSEHQRTECLNVKHLFELRDHMVNIDTSKFVIERDPKAYVPSVKKKSFYPGSMGLSRLAPQSIEDLVWSYPHQVAAFLEDEGLTFDELNHYVMDQGERQAS